MSSLLIALAWLQEPKPLIIQTVRQPPITQEITMGDVVIGAANLVGTVMGAAAAEAVPGANVDSVAARNAAAAAIHTANINQPSKTALAS